MDMRVGTIIEASKKKKKLLILKGIPELMFAPSFQELPSFKPEDIVGKSDRISKLGS
jgi:hypothetical protein